MSANVCLLEFLLPIRQVGIHANIQETLFFFFFTLRPYKKIRQEERWMDNRQKTCITSSFLPRSLGRAPEPGPGRVRAMKRLDRPTDQNFLLELFSPSHTQSARFGWHRSMIRESNMVMNMLNGKMGNLEKFNWHLIQSLQCRRTDQA